MRAVKHIAVILMALLLTLGLPAAMYLDIPALLQGKTAIDDTSGATIELPAQPSGEFLVFLNRQKHADTTGQWELFFSGGDAGVIMSDVDCRVAAADAAAMKMACCSFPKPRLGYLTRLSCPRKWPIATKPILFGSSRILYWFQ